MDLWLLGHRGKGQLFWDAGESEFAVGLSDFKDFVCLWVHQGVRLMYVLPLWPNSAQKSSHPQSRDSMVSRRTMAGRHDDRAYCAVRNSRWMYGGSQEEKDSPKRPECKSVSNISGSRNVAEKDEIRLE